MLGRVLVAVALIGLAGCAEWPEGSPAAPDEVVSRRVIDHFERTVTTPGVSLRVARIGDSEIRGWRRGVLEVTLGSQTQSVPFYVRRDGRYLFRGEVADLTLDPDAEAMRRIDVTGRPSRGPVNAAVTIVEYADFQCPGSASAFAVLEGQILPRYADRVRFVFKHFPLSAIHPWAERAALAAECAHRQGSEPFWVMYRTLFSRQAEIGADTLDRTVLEVARAQGLDVPAFETCLEGRETLEAVRADEREAAALDITATPMFFVNGRRVAGAQTGQAFRDVIERELDLHDDTSHAPR